MTPIEIGTITLLGVLVLLQVYEMFFRVHAQDDNSALLERMKLDNDRALEKMTDKLYDMQVRLTQAIGEGAKENIKDLGTFKDNLGNAMTLHFERMNRRIEEQMEQINKKVEYRLNEGFEKTNKTFTNIVERLSKIDEAQKNIQQLSTEVVSLQHLLSDKKTRGTFGEVQLSQILAAIFGDRNEKVYGTQVTLSNGTRADAILYLPEEMGDLAIDSKFPLEHYTRMADRTLSERDRELATRAFKADMRRHVDDIASKYIIPGETSDQAVLFVPAEAIFAEINAYHQDIVDYAQTKRVWIASPTTLMSLLTTVQVLLRNVERDKYAKVIQDELSKLGAEFARYQERWDKLSRNIDTVHKSVKDIHVTSSKIGKRFEEISHVKLERIDASEEE
jgi:DNA recombination protein RmuC